MWSYMRFIVDHFLNTGISISMRAAELWFSYVIKVSKNADREDDRNWHTNLGLKLRLNCAACGCVSISTLIIWYTYYTYVSEMPFDTRNLSYICVYTILMNSVGIEPEKKHVRTVSQESSDMRITSQFTNLLVCPRYVACWSSESVRIFKWTDAVYVDDECVCAARYSSGTKLKQRRRMLLSPPDRIDEMCDLCQAI